MSTARCGVMAELRLNKSGNRRGIYAGNKGGRKSIRRGTAQYIRTCDSRVGKWLREHQTGLYNRLLERADAVAKGQ